MSSENETGVLSLEEYRSLVTENTQLRGLVEGLQNLTGLQKRVIVRLNKYINDEDSFMKEFITHVTAKGVPLIPEVMYALVGPGTHGRIWAVSKSLEQLTGCGDGLHILNRPWPELINKAKLGDTRYKTFLRQLMEFGVQEAFLPISCFNGDSKDVWLIKDPIMYRDVHLGSVITYDSGANAAEQDYCVKGLEDEELLKMYEIMRQANQLAKTFRERTFKDRSSKP